MEMIFYKLNRSARNSKGVNFQGILLETMLLNIMPFVVVVLYNFVITLSIRTRPSSAGHFISGFKRNLHNTLHNNFTKQTYFYPA